MKFPYSLNLLNPAVKFMAGRYRRGAGQPLAGVVILILLFLTPPAPAAAHDAIEAVEPPNGSVLPVVPTAVKLTLNNTPIALGAEVEIKDQNGSNQADGAVLITDNVVSRGVKAGAPAGRYTVSWRVVSSDSHPIEGRYTFTAGKTSGPCPSPEASAVPSIGRSETAMPAGNPWAFVAGGSVLVAVLLATAWSVR